MPFCGISNWDKRIFAIIIITLKIIVKEKVARRSKAKIDRKHKNDGINPLNRNFKIKLKIFLL